MLSKYQYRSLVNVLTIQMNEWNNKVVNEQRNSVCLSTHKSQGKLCSLSIFIFKYFKAHSGQQDSW